MLQLGIQDPQSDTLDLGRLVPPDACVVVEVGRKSVSLLSGLRRWNPTVTYYGIQHNPFVAKDVSQDLDRVVIGDAEQMQAADLGLQPGTVDCLVYNDVLADFRNPWDAMRRQVSWLRDGGLVIASIPNVQHWTMFLHMLLGDWTYQEQGVLDRQHLRFFSLDTLKELFTRAGLQVAAVYPQQFPSEQFQMLRLVLSPVLRKLNINEQEFDARTQALQYVVQAVKSPQLPKRPFFTTYVGEPFVCARVRVFDPQRCLNTIPCVRAVVTLDGELEAGHSDEEKVLIYQRIIFGRSHFPFQRELLHRGYLIIAEWDDDPDHFPQTGADEYLTFAACHCVQTSTPSLADELRRYNAHVQVFPNQLAELPPPRQYADTGRVTLFFGAVNRQPDWEPLMPALNRVLADLGDRVRVRVIWDQPFFDALQTPHKDFEVGCPFERYAEILRDCDIALVPLNATRFNSFKSDLKFIECASHGVTVLASPTVYGETLRPEENGLLFHSAGEFETQLRRLIEDQDLRVRLAKNAYQYVAQSRLLGQHYRARYEWYLKMLDQLPQLNADLRQRVPELFTE